MDVQEIYFTLAADAERPFRQIVQGSEETVDQFVCRLCQRVINCEFGENENGYIRDQVIKLSSYQVIKLSSLFSLISCII